MTPLKGIVFDLDDTLYSQKSFKRSGFIALSQWLASNRGLNYALCLKVLEQIMDQKGPSYPFIFDEMVIALNLDQELVPEMVQVFVKHRPQIACFPGVKSMLRRLCQKYHVGILTDGRLEVQRRKIRSLGLMGCVDAVLFSAQLGLEKPAEPLFAWFEDHFALPGKQLLYVGDNPQKDFIGAKQRAWRTIHVLTGEVMPEIVSPAHQADIRLNSVRDLEPWLAELHNEK